MNATTTKARTPAQIEGAARAAATRAANRAAKQTPAEALQDESSAIVPDIDLPTFEEVSAAALPTVTGPAFVDPRQVEASQHAAKVAAHVAKQATAKRMAEELAAELDTTIEDAHIEITTGYTGPMLALRERLAAGAYSKAINGQPCCGDAIAIKLGTLNPAQVIRACIVAMNLPNNPYTHLNVGQQSMNLRNKLRGCMKRGEFGFGVVAEAVEQVEEEAATA